MKVLMLPLLEQAKGQSGGISRVIEGWHKTAADHDIEYVTPNHSFDLFVSHAGAGYAQTGIWPDIAATHGLYFSNDYTVSKSHMQVNANVIEEVRHAKLTTCPSHWVARTFQRDMRFTPRIIPHGIDWDAWQHDFDSSYYVLWNKNRAGDACNPIAVEALSVAFPDVQFVTTFAEKKRDNIHITGVMNHEQMKPIVQQAGVYLSTARETFGIGVLEALASGVPVLGWNFGGNRELVEHGVTGYLAEPDDYEDLADGLEWCAQYRDTLSSNAREAARQWTWDKVGELVAGVYQDALRDEKPEPLATVVIPCFNYATKVCRAIESVKEQTLTDFECFVVDDGSTDNTEEAVAECIKDDARFQYIKTVNRGVAHARNTGIKAGSAPYISCLDADDAIEPNFLEELIPVLEYDNSLGIAYSKLRLYMPSHGHNKVGSWPTEFNYNKQLKKQNQVPTCCVFRREAWERLGGYRQR